MKAIKCKLVVNTSNGYCMTPILCNSIAEAKKHAIGMGFAYRIFNEEGKLISKGFC